MRTSPRTNLPWITGGVWLCGVVLASSLNACGSDEIRAEEAAIDGGVDAPQEAPPPPWSGDFGDASLDAGDDCSDTAKRIYVFSSAQTGDAGYKPPALYSLEPLAKKITFIGNLGSNLGSFGVTPVAISILRDGISGYVSDGAHRLWKVSLADGTVDPTPVMDFVAAGGKSSDNYMIALVGDGKGHDTLYAQGYSKTFFKVDPTAGTLTSIGALPRLCDLTGTNDGRLFGFCDDKTVKQIAPDVAEAIASDPVPKWKSTWAIAFWGGEYWLFFGDRNSPSELHRYDPVTKTSTPWMNATELGGIMIPGAGVSTCAPLTLK